jgi:hypothetical protein
MFWRGEKCGVAFNRMDFGTMTNTWSFRIGWSRDDREGWPYYRRGFEIRWLPLRDCFEWRVDFLGIEYSIVRKERSRVILQYRINRWLSWPLQVSMAVKS